MNILYKLYTICINFFLSNILLPNNIVAPEQASVKQGVWGKTEQLLINKSILNDATKLNNSLVRLKETRTPYLWLIQTLKLAKAPQKVVNAIETLTNRWYTILTINSRDESITTDIIKFLKGVFQRDSLSVLVFLISLNPL